MELYRMQKRESFGFSAENPTGQKSGGTKGKDCEKLRPCIQIASGETVTLCDTDGPGMITHIWFTGYVGHSFVMRIYWENEEFPSVEAPISAFFGCAYDENFKDRDGNYIVLNSAKILTAPGRGFNSYWEMPFHKHCRITMENRGKKEETLYYMITGWHGEIPESAGYFHAAYRQEHPVTKGRAYTIIDGIEGRGCFAGVTLATGMNGNNTCWVEGFCRSLESPAIMWLRLICPTPVTAADRPAFSVSARMAYSGMVFSIKRRGFSIRITSTRHKAEREEISFRFVLLRSDQGWLPLNLLAASLTMF